MRVTHNAWGVKRFGELDHKEAKNLTSQFYKIESQAQALLQMSNTFYPFFYKFHAFEIKFLRADE